MDLIDAILIDFARELNLYDTLLQQKKKRADDAIAASWATWYD